MPRNAASGLCTAPGSPIRSLDIARTNFLLVLGSNLLVSNGSTMSSPNLPDKLRALRRRGGRLVVVDPVQTRTTKIADEHLAIRPGADAFLLMALVSVLAEENLVQLGAADGHVAGLAELLAIAAPFTPESVAERCGIPAATIRRLARDLAAADGAAVYARLGGNVQEFGTVASWLVEALNVLTGNLDRPGGAMFPLPPAGGGNTASGTGHGLAAFSVEHPGAGPSRDAGRAAAGRLAEEIDTPGDGQVRALITVAGNIARSAPNSARLDKAFEQLEFMVCIDNYLNETTRHADVILPGARLTTRGHFDVVINHTASHNAARYSPALVPLRDGELSEREIILRFTSIVRGTYESFDSFDAEAADHAAAVKQASKLPLPDGASPEDAVAACGAHRGNERMLDLMLRSGPYGDGFGAPGDGLTIDALLAAPDGIDLGEPQPRLPGAIRTPSGRIELAPELIVSDVDRLRSVLARPAPELVLVGRRQVRGMNSWLHNTVPPHGVLGLHLARPSRRRPPGRAADRRPRAGEFARSARWRSTSR